MAAEAGSHARISAARRVRRPPPPAEPTKASAYAFSAARRDRRSGSEVSRIQWYGSLHDLPCADTLKGTFFATGSVGRAAALGRCGCEGWRELRRQEVAKRRRNAPGHGRRQSIGAGLMVSLWTGLLLQFCSLVFAAEGVGWAGPADGAFKRKEWAGPSDGAFKCSACFF